MGLVKCPDGVQHTERHKFLRPRMPYRRGSFASKIAMLSIAQISYLELSVAACTQKEVDSVFEAAKKAQKVSICC